VKAKKWDGPKGGHGPYPRTTQSDSSTCTHNRLSCGTIIICHTTTTNSEKEATKKSTIGHPHTVWHHPPQVSSEDGNDRLNIHSVCPIVVVTIQSKITPSLCVQYIQSSIDSVNSKKHQQQ
jgi:hypothetical protein